MDEVLPAHEYRFAGCPDGSTPSPPTTNGGWRSCWPRSAATRRYKPWELAGQLTLSRPWAEYGGQMRIFAVTETAAHLDLLEHRGLVTVSDTRPSRYTAVASDDQPRRSPAGGCPRATSRARFI